MTVVTADVLIPGKGEPIENGCVAFNDGKITFVGPKAELPTDAKADKDIVEVPVVMPGMWDAHCHVLGLRPPGGMNDLMSVPTPLMAARAVTDVQAALDAGFTSLRDAGGFGIEFATAVKEGSIRGPNIYSAGDIISQTAGHADLHDMPSHCVEYLYKEMGAPMLTADGVAECRKAVRLQLRRGADVIKIATSGGVMSERDNPIDQQFCSDETQALVEEAHRYRRNVMAHCHGKAGIKSALDAGVDTLEHATYLDEELAAQMAEQGTILVPTIFVMKLIEMVGPDVVGQSVFDKDKEILATSQAVELAHAAGVKIATGTDLLVSGTPPWGMNGAELGLLVERGLTPLEAIEAATANGPLTLGPRAPKSGILAEGYDADVIAVAANPLEDISLLAQADKITKVWRAGKLEKDRD